MFTREIGALLRGKATPTQLMLACVLGATLGFMPGFTQAGGLIVLLLLCLVILNANLPLAAMVGAVAKLLSLLLMPVSFEVGRLLLDGPTQGLFQSMINAPVLALFGFEYYATTGGLLFGLVFGLAVGFGIVRGVGSFRRKMADLEENSDKYKKYSAKSSVQWITWLIFGGSSKQKFSELKEAKGWVIRPIGVVFAALVVVLLVVLQQFFTGPIVVSVLKSELERANGAQVDIESAEADLAAGRIDVIGLAVTDPAETEKNLLEAERVEVDLSNADLLRKRFTLDKVVVVDGQHGTKRKVPGYIVGNPPRPTPEEDVETREGEQTIDDYIEQAKVWKERLAQIRDWLEYMSRDDADATETEREETLEERLRREIREKGYANVYAAHLITGAPQLTVTELVADKVRVAQMPDETLDVRGEHLSTQPYLLDKTPRLTIKSSGDTLGLDVAMASVSALGGDSTVDFDYRGLIIDTIAQQLPTFGGAKPIAGGKMDVSLDGKLFTAGGVKIDMPLNITMHNTTITVPGAGQAPVDRMILPLGLRGPIDNPRIKLNNKNLSDALVQAGASALANKLGGKAGEAINKATGNLTDKVGGKLGDKVGGEIGEKASGALKGLFGGKKDKDK